LLLALSLLSGCSDRQNVEDVTFALLLGIDLDEEDRLVYFLSSPVFSKEAREKEEHFEVHTETLRSSREEFDRRVVAMSMGGKVQSLLLGKRLLRHKGWFELLDPLYRDNKNTVLALAVLVDGPVSELMDLSPKDKPRLPTYVTELISTAKRRNITMSTTLQELHRQMYDKAMTPSITQLKVEQGHLNLMGTALLKEDGRYAITLNPSENKLFALLYPHRNGIFPFTFTNPSQPRDGFFKHNLLSFTASGISTKTNSSFVNGRFRFDVQVKLKISFSELLFPIDVEKQGKQLEKQIEREFEKQYDKLFAKMQQAKVDPIGFGFYARARQYRQWKEVQEHWEEAFSDAEVNVKVKVKIMAMGATK